MDCDLTEAKEYFKDNILPLKSQIDDYNLVYIGGIGVGKSTIIKATKEIFDEFEPQIIHEYLEANPELGQTLLSAFINKEISPITFQNAILDIYEKQLKNKKKSKITIYERIPDDNLTIFSNLSYFQNELTISSFNDLYLRTIELDKKYYLPSYLVKNAKFTKIISPGITDLISLVLQIIKDDILNGVKYRIIGLSANLDICKLHIHRRNRKDENKYSDTYLNSIIKTYDNLYNILENDYNINLLNIGRFIN